MMRVTRLVAVLVLGLLVPLTSYAGVDEIRHDAMQGDTAAQYEMGILYEFGFHLADHETEALAWYGVAAERGSESAARRRDLLSARLSAAQRAKADERRHELMTGMPTAMPPTAMPVEPVTPPPVAAPAPAPTSTPNVAMPPEPTPPSPSPEPAPTPSAEIPVPPMPAPVAEPSPEPVPTP